MKYISKKERVNKGILVLPFLLTFILLVESVRGQITVSAGKTAAQLAKVLTGQGVTVLNPTLNCPVAANGIFSEVSNTLGIDSGIVLTTGYAATQGSRYGVNGYSAWLASNDNGAPGDPQLDSLYHLTTLDACALEFDVIPTGDTLKFNYVFSSEEYMNAVCGTFNDAFAFFISGPGITGEQNIALVPGTNIPVTINSINNGIPGSSGSLTNCTSMGPGSPFTSYYVENGSGQYLTHKGLTEVMTALHAVDACNTYHLKMVIADATDPLYDSGVFLKAGSLQTGSFNLAGIVNLPAITPNPVCIKACLPGQIRVKRTQVAGTAQGLAITTSGTAVSGYDYAPLPDSIVIAPNDTTAMITVTGLATPLTGARTLTVYLHAPFNCVGVSTVVDSATVVIYDTVHLTPVFTDTTICNGVYLQLNVAGSPLMVYGWSPAAGLSNPGVGNPVADPTGPTLYTVSGYIPGTPCPLKQGTVYVGLKPAPLVKSVTDTVVCYNRPLTLSPHILLENPYYSFSWVGPDSFSSALKNPIIDTLLPATAGVYTLTVTLDTDGCTATEIANVSAYVPPVPVYSGDSFVCIHDPAVTLSATGSFVRWWATMSDTATISAPMIATDREGSYQFFVTQTIRGCESPREQVDVAVKSCCDGKIFIPNAFSPNNDGNNDVFHVRPDFGYYVKQILIMNRWGQVVYEGSQVDWDGTAAGAHCETGVYYYILKLACIRGGEVVRTGDITLIR
jgi:gliding motility-associated-like protein